MHGFRFRPFFFAFEGRTQTAQHIQRLWILISRPFPPQGQRFAMYSFCFRPFAFGFQRQTQTAHRFKRIGIVLVQRLTLYRKGSAQIRIGFVQISSLEHAIIDQVKRSGQIWMLPTKKLLAHREGFLLQRFRLI